MNTRPVHAPLTQFPVLDDCLQIGGMSLTRLAQRVGQTPFYAYDRQKITERVVLLRQHLPEEIQHLKTQCDANGHSLVYIAVDDSLAGVLELQPCIRPETREIIRYLKAQNISLTIISGDHEQPTRQLANELGIEHYFSETLPDKKAELVAKLREEGKFVAYVGDGINDAPVLARADVGVAMGALGSDAAVETADVVLMNDSPLKMAEAVSIAKQTRRIVWQNIMLAFFVKGIFLIFGAMGLATMWEAVFADMGTALLAVVNSTRIIGKSDPL